MVVSRAFAGRTRSVVNGDGDCSGYGVLVGDDDTQQGCIAAKLYNLVVLVVVVVM